LKRRLIVNADDFGLTRGVSLGILRAHRHGIVTSTTMLVNREVDRDVLDAARASGLGIGLHVNLTLGAPITGGRSLVDGAGRFVRDPRRAAATASVADVEAEVAAQVERFQTVVKRPPTHLDTHHHVGLYDPVAEIVLDIARQLGVPVRSQNAAARARARCRALRTTDHFFGESGPDAYWTASRTLERVRNLPPGTSEFMTHPGMFDEALGYSRYGRQRETELVGLGTATARTAVASHGIDLCHFGQL
jgi:predicted glycoside hydrolase/deacetylase ChbG (UPF0249 family)